MKKILAIGVAAAGMTALAGGWNFSAGPSWRARVKSELSGAVPVTTPAASHTAGYDKDVPGKSDWTAGDIATGDIVLKADPSTPGADVWAGVGNYRETTVVPGAGSARLRSSDEDSPLGLRVNGGYDWDVGERFSVGVNVMFAGYWNMKSSARGSAQVGTETTTSYSDYWLFSGGPYPDDPFSPTDFTGFQTDPSAYTPYRDNYTSQTHDLGSRSVSARIRSDLYQIGLGPKATWHACSWLDAYAGVNALCNIANMELSTSSGDASEVKCRFGVGADVGLAAFLTDWLGLYADIGYEWVDKANVSAGNVSADVDFSSLVVGVGMIFRF